VGISRGLRYKNLNLDMEPELTSLSTGITKVTWLSRGVVRNGRKGRDEVVGGRRQRGSTATSCELSQ